MICKIAFEEKAYLMTEFENLRYALEQVAGITNAVRDALYSGNDGADYAPALGLASNELERQQEKLEELLKRILKY